MHKKISKKGSKLSLLEYYSSSNFSWGQGEYKQKYFLTCCGDILYFCTRYKDKANKSHYLLAETLISIEKSAKVKILESIKDKKRGGGRKYIHSIKRKLELVCESTAY